MLLKAGTEFKKDEQLMTQSEKCIYCSNLFNPTKGAGDHILPVQLGEFRKDIRFRKICPVCNNKIGRSEQQLLLSGPPSFFRDLVDPKVPRRRRRGRSKVKGAMGVPGPMSTIDEGDHHQLVRRSKENPKNVFPVDHVVIHDSQDQEYFIELFVGMQPKHLRDRLKKRGITEIKKIWFHFDSQHSHEFTKLVNGIWPEGKIQSLPETDAGIKKINGRITFKVTDHYFRSLAKIAFHYYLVHSRRGFRGDEGSFKAVRDFIMNGGQMEMFFKQTGAEFITPFGDIPFGGVVTNKQWCHILAADESRKVAVIHVQLFVGPGCLPHPHYIKLADIDSSIIVPNSTWGHVYLYDESSKSDRYAGRVEEAQITRVR